MNIKTIIILLISIGMGSLVEAQNSGISMGRSIASGESSFAAGDTSLAEGKAAVAIGYRTLASGDFSFAVGANTIAGGLGSFAGGTGSSVAENASGGIAIGYYSSAEAENSVAMGVTNRTAPSAIGAAAFGAANTALGDGSFVAGQGNTSHSFGEVVLGQFSLGYTGYTTFFNKVLTDRLFTIGNGEDSDNRSNALVMFKSGNTELNGNLDIQKRINIGDDTELASPGDMRFNESTQDFEGYTGSGWVSLTGSAKPGVQRVTEKGFWPVINVAPLRYMYGAIVGQSQGDILGSYDDPNNLFDNTIQIAALDFAAEKISGQPYGTATLHFPYDKASIKLIEAFKNSETLTTIKISTTAPSSSGTTQHVRDYTFEDAKITGFDYKFESPNNRYNPISEVHLNRMTIIFTRAKIENYSPNNEHEIIYND